MGSGTIHMPALPLPKPLRVAMTSPTRKPSLYDVRSSVAASQGKDGRKAGLLKKVVREKELQDLLSRLCRPTASSRLKSARARPKVDYVDMGYYQWNRMAVYADYQRQMYSSTGAVKPSFRKCGGQRTAVVGRSCV